MPAVIHSSWLLFAMGAAMGLFLGGVAAGIHLLNSRVATTSSWQQRLAQRATASPWGGRDLLLVVLLVSASQLVRRWLASPAIIWDVLAFQGVAWAGIIGLGVFKTAPMGVAIPRWKRLQQAVIHWLAILPLLWFATFVWQWLLKILGHPPDFQLAVKLALGMRNPWTLTGFFMLAVFLVPFVEEMIFRGMLLPLLVRRVGSWAGVAASALVFAVLHMDSGTFLALFILAIALSLAYARTGSLWVPIGMHMLFNGANLLLLLALHQAGVLTP